MILQTAIPGVQKYVWNEAGKLTGNIVEIIFDELVRSATDGGIGTHRCEIIAHSIAAISSISIRGKLFSKLRKVSQLYLPSHIRVLNRNFRPSSRLRHDSLECQHTTLVGLKFRH